MQSPNLVCFPVTPLMRGSWWCRGNEMQIKASARDPSLNAHAVRNHGENPFSNPVPLIWAFSSLVKWFIRVRDASQVAPRIFLQKGKNQQNNASTWRWEGEETRKKMKTLFNPFEFFCFYNHYATRGILQCITLKHLCCHILGIFDTLYFLSSYSPCTAKSLAPAHFQSATCLSKSCSSRERCLQWIKHTLLFSRSLPFIWTESKSQSSNKQPTTLSFPFKVDLNLSFVIQLVFFF